MSERAARDAESPFDECGGGAAPGHPRMYSRAPRKKRGATLRQLVPSVELRGAPGSEATEGQFGLFVARSAFSCPVRRSLEICSLTFYRERGRVGQSSA